MSGAVATIRAALDVLVSPGQVIELRVPKVDGKKSRTDAGYFNDLDKLAAAAARYDGRGDGVYITLNEINPALLARAANRVKDYNEQTTSDTDVIRRRWLPIDTDPRRPAGVSSTDAEHAAALQRAVEVQAWLTSLGWPDPVRADSGNGGHLLYPVDLPNDDDSRRRVDQCLKVLDLYFSDDVVGIDTTVFNAGRIWKVYGTQASKGDSMPDRPHRRAALLGVPNLLEVVPVALLQALATHLPKETSTTQRNGSVNGSAGHITDIAAWLREHNVAYRTKDWEKGTVYVLNECPFDSNHKGTARLTQFQSGALDFGCFHNSCNQKDLRAFLKQVNPNFTRPGDGAAVTKNGNGSHRRHASTTLEHVPPNQHPIASTELQTTSAAAILNMEFEAIRWIVLNLIAVGLVLLAGRPKAGKSWISLALAIAVSSGGRAFGSIPVEQGSVLYLSLEDTKRRLKDRLRKVIGDDPIPTGLEFVTLDDDFPRLHDGGLERIETWLNAHQDARLIIIDTLKKVRAPQRVNTNVYDQDYESVDDLLKLAARHGVGVLVVHHTRKSKAEDAIEEVSGSFGLTANVDSVIVFRRAQGATEATLHVVGRDVEDQELALTWDAQFWQWVILGDAAQVRMSRERKAVIAALQAEARPMGPKEISEELIAAGLSIAYDYVRQLLSRMARDGVVIVAGRGLYRLPSNEQALAKPPSQVSQVSQQRIKGIGKPQTNVTVTPRDLSHSADVSQSNVTEHPDVTTADENLSQPSEALESQETSNVTLVTDVTGTQYDVPGLIERARARIGDRS